MKALALDPSPRARLQLIGSLSIARTDGEALVVARPGRAILACAYLAASSVPRKDLAAVLWSGRGAPQARASLRQALLDLRRALDTAGLELVEISTNDVCVRRGALTSDVDELVSALDRDEISAAVTALRQAGSAQVLGDVQADGPWLARMREVLSWTISTAVVACLERLEAVGRHHHVVELAEAYLERDPIERCVVASAIRADEALGTAAGTERRLRKLRAALATARPTSTPPATKTSALPWSRFGGLVGAGDRPLVAVATFDGAESSGLASDRLHAVRREVLSGLSRFRDVHVVTVNRSVEQMCTTTGADPAIAYVLGASVAPSGGGTVLTAELVDADAGRVMWSERVSLAGDAATEAAIVRMVGGVLPAIDAELAQYLRPDGLYPRFVRARTRTLAAQTFEDARAACDELEALIAAEPRFLAPYAALASMYLTDFAYTRAFSSGRAERARALELAKAANAMDPLHGQGHTVAGWCYLGEHRWDLAARSFEQALESNAFHPQRLMNVAKGFLYLGDLARARALLDRCAVVQTIPGDRLLELTGLVACFDGEHERAATSFELVARPTPLCRLSEAVNDALARRPRAHRRDEALRTAVIGIWPPGLAPKADDVVAWYLGHVRPRDAALQQTFETATRRAVASVFAS